MIEQLSHEINLVKIQLKNDIKSYFEYTDSNIDDIKCTLKEIQSVNSKLSSQNSDNKKEFVKLQKKQDDKNSDYQCQVDTVQKEITILTKEMQDLNNRIDEMKNLTLNQESQNETSKDLHEPDQAKLHSKLNTLHVPDLDSDEQTDLHVDDHSPMKSNSSFSHRYDTTKQKSNPTPMEKLNCLNLDDENLRKVDQILIGDSQIKYINPVKMFKDNSPNAEIYSKKICVPGITAYEIYEWLGFQNVQPGVKLVVIHVGANVCIKGNTILEDHWAKLIRRAKKIFPNAHLTMSSMIPVGSRHHLHQAIMTSIDNLKEACSKLDVSFAENTNIFLSRNWAPRREFLENAFHPNLKGSIKLSLNIRYYSVYSYYTPDNNSYDNNTKTMLFQDDYQSLNGCSEYNHDMNEETSKLNSASPSKLVCKTPHDSYLAAAKMNLDNNSSQGKLDTKESAIDAIKKLSQILLSLIV